MVTRKQRLLLLFFALFYGIHGAESRVKRTQDEINKIKKNQKKTILYNFKKDKKKKFDRPIKGGRFILHETEIDFIVQKNGKITATVPITHTPKAMHEYVFMKIEGLNKKGKPIIILDTNERYKKREFFDHLHFDKKEGNEKKTLYFQLETDSPAQLKRVVDYRFDLFTKRELCQISHFENIRQTKQIAYNVERSAAFPLEEEVINKAGLVLICNEVDLVIETNGQLTVNFMLKNQTKFYMTNFWLHFNFFDKGDQLLFSTDTFGDNKYKHYQHFDIAPGELATYSTSFFIAKKYKKSLKNISTYSILAFGDSSIIQAPIPKKEEENILYESTSKDIAPSKVFQHNTLTIYNSTLKVMDNGKINWTGEIESKKKCNFYLKLDLLDQNEKSLIELNTNGKNKGNDKRRYALKAKERKPFNFTISTDAYDQLEKIQKGNYKLSPIMVDAEDQIEESKTYAKPKYKKGKKFFSIMDKLKKNSFSKEEKKKELKKSGKKDDTAPSKFVFLKTKKGTYLLIGGIVFTALLILSLVTYFIYFPKKVKKKPQGNKKRKMKKKKRATSSLTKVQQLQKKEKGSSFVTKTQQLQKKSSSQPKG